MSNDLVKREAAEIVDGFDGTLSDGRVTKGTILLWDRTKHWHDRDDQPVPTRLLVYDVKPVLRRWVDNKPDYITTHPLPDPRDLNAAIPQGEWQIGLGGKPRPPWEPTIVMYFIEELTGRLFTFQSSTNGARIAADLLHEQVTVKRMMVRKKVKPIVELGEGMFKTRDFGMVPRPGYTVVDWREPEPEPEAEPKKLTTDSAPSQPPESTSTAPSQAPAATETKPEAAPPVKKSTKAKSEAKAGTKSDAKSDTKSDAVDPYFNDAIPWQ
jgi:hypothetical protein